MHYNLPAEEDIDTIRAEIRSRYDEEYERQRQYTLSRYIHGFVLLSDCEPEAIRRVVDGVMRDRVRRATGRDWHAIRAEVYTRDNAICHVCGRHVLWEYYECGHIIDRVCGGSDRPSNLIVMCVRCNRMKPCHETRTEYIDWLNAGDWRASVLEQAHRIFSNNH